MSTCWAKKINPKHPIFILGIWIFLQTPYYHANGLFSGLLLFVNTCHHFCSSSLFVFCVCDRSSVPCSGTTRLSVSPRNRLSGCTRASSPALLNRCVSVRIHEDGWVLKAGWMFCILQTNRTRSFLRVPAGDGASVCASTAAGLCPERLRGRRGCPDSQTDPQRGQELQSCERTMSVCLSVCVFVCYSLSDELKRTQMWHRPARRPHKWMILSFYFLLH